MMDGAGEGAGVSPYEDMERSREMEGMEAVEEGRWEGWEGEEVSSCWALWSSLVANFPERTLW